MTASVARARRPEGQHGFTLIELLVVIIVLGIISAVVVFAVRGSGDKGEQAAKDTDLRTLRTAQEAFCARYGRYAATEQELVKGPAGIPGAKGFLSEESQYHDIEAVSPTGPAPKCNGTGYRITGGGTPTTIAPADPLCTPGSWCEIAAPEARLSTGRNKVLQLGNGKVLFAAEEALTGLDEEIVVGITSTTGVQSYLYDPNANAAGEWTKGPVARTVGQNARLTTMVLLEGTPAQCGQRCGMVLAHFGSRPGHWKLYDPAVAPTGRWTAIDPPAAYSRNVDVAAVQLRDDPAVAGAECAGLCGKVLIVGQSTEGTGSTRTPPIAELYDPVTNTFGQVADAYGEPGNFFMASSLTALPDGRVLMVGTIGSLTAPRRYMARLFNPGNATFDEIAPPLRLYMEGGVTLPGGNGILFIPAEVSDVTQVYRPDDGAGSWDAVPNCPRIAAQGPFGNTNCFILGSLADGRVLVSRSTGYHRVPSASDRLTFLFDAGESDPTKRWSETGALNYTQSPGAPVLLQASRGACGSKCGRVIAAGDKKAEMYTP